ncbi:hypothetical protein F511_41367 [Dorcoceras hygrometricum]|uniref:Uncharacterized protein n=1 Tax=Dorcoceras hygrometricum TaxID=472368 RepID=A0A2Z7AKK2_9LAMI|nr:hypothetical protein F511_41367 [Dorcoceras hygrometricum]
MTIAKLLWDSMEKKYKTEVSGLKKFIVGKFLDYRMVDSKSVMSMQLILHDLHAEGMSNAIIGVVTTGFECHGLTGFDDHGPMISTD